MVKRESFKRDDACNVIMKDLYEGFIHGNNLYVPKEPAELLSADPFSLITNFNENNLELLVVSSKNAFAKLRKRFIENFDRQFPHGNPSIEQLCWMKRTDMSHYSDRTFSVNDEPVEFRAFPLAEKTIQGFGRQTRNWVDIVPEEGRLMVFKPEAIGTFYTTRAFAHIPEKYLSPEKKSA